MAETDPRIIQEYRQVFTLFDENGDNRISETELHTVMLSLGSSLSKKELEDIMREVDLNRNGFIDFNEFVMLMEKQSSQTCEEADLKHAFEMFDKDGSGYIDKEEFRDAMTTLGETLTEEELAGMMAAADTNGDGKIQYEEFVALLYKN